MEALPLPPMVHCCPICFGRGFVAPGFYSISGRAPILYPEVCRSCGGRGYVTVSLGPPPAPLGIEP